MPWVQTAAPAVLAISLDDLKGQVRFTEASEDTLLELYIQAAIDLVEEYTSRRLISRTFRYDAPCFPCGDIELPLAPLVSVESVQYLLDGELETWDAENYTVWTGRRLGRVKPKRGVPYPVTDTDRADAMQVNFTAGYGADPADVPAGLRLALLFLAGHFFANRIPVAQVNMSQVPNTLQYALDAYKIRSI